MIMLRRLLCILGFHLFVVVRTFEEKFETGEEECDGTYLTVVFFCPHCGLESTWTGKEDEDEEFKKDISLDKKEIASLREDLSCIRDKNTKMRTELRGLKDDLYTVTTFPDVIDSNWEGFIRLFMLPKAYGLSEEADGIDEHRSYRQFRMKLEDVKEEIKVYESNP